VIEGPPASVFTGPLLAQASYPKVLVARAFSAGDDLDLVLFNGAAAGPQTIGLERLRPDGAYQVRGGQGGGFTAGGDGTASLSVDLDGRAPLHIVTTD
jgi:hypothetical protein